MISTQEDTIAAISTALGEGAIGIIRVSGPQAIASVDQLFRGKVKLAEVPSHTIHYGHLIDPRDGQKVEEVLVSVMRAPRTFTREDVVEVNCHGGMMSVQLVLNLILETGVRLAEPGEFTKRAFLNGRIDLTQAEAVMEMIRAKSERALKAALRQVEGSLSRAIREVRQDLLALLAHIEVTIDYPEYDIEEVTYGELLQQVEQIEHRLEQMISSAHQGNLLREGISTVIVGRPNVGKSSLMNLLTRENRAIVTDIPGTTRDILEEVVSVRGIPLRIIDTAGIRETEDPVEKIGVQRSRQALEEADLALLVINANERLTQEDRELIGLLKDRMTLVLLNKSDLPEHVEREYLESVFPGRVLTVSARLGKGMEQLFKKIEELFFSGKLVQDEVTYVANSRHMQLLKQSLQMLQEAREGLLQHVPLDMVGIDLRQVWMLLGEMIGEEAGEALLDQIFSQFCLGK